MDSDIVMAQKLLDKALYHLENGFTNFIASGEERKLVSDLIVEVNKGRLYTFNFSKDFDQAIFGGSVLFLTMKINDQYHLFVGISDSIFSDGRPTIGVCTSQSLESEIRIKKNFNLSVEGKKYTLSEIGVMTKGARN